MSKRTTKTRLKNRKGLPHALDAKIRFRVVPGVKAHQAVEACLVIGRGSATGRKTGYKKTFPGNPGIACGSGKNPRAALRNMFSKAKKKLGLRPGALAGLK